MKIFCNVFLHNHYFYADFPQSQLLRFCYCLFIESKKFMIQLSAFINRRFFKFFILYACPHTNYNYDYLKILNEEYYQFLLHQKKYNKLSSSQKRIPFKKVYNKSVLKFFKDDWNKTFHSNA